MDLRGKAIVAKYAWIGGKIGEEVAIEIDEKGVITNVGGIPSGEVLRLENEVLLPGFVNSHSHAFHRHLRGRSEIGRSAADTFWKWRDNMYGLVADVDKDVIYRYCATTFREMLAAGITSVGEFHYVHHANNRFDLDGEVVRAAVDTGIRLVLLETLYEQAGFDAPPLHPVQERFVSSYDAFIQKIQELRRENKHPRVSFGVAAHSARAVTFQNIKKLYNYAVAENLPFHIHLEEQPKEIADCQKFLGKTQGPSDILLTTLNLGEHFTGVHATYTSAANMRALASLGANVSICPCTEGYLGDGIPQINEDLPISFGSDCNNRICMLEEMRWACFSQQMRGNSRSVAALSAEKLLSAATEGGARSLGLAAKVGDFQVGKYFDAVTLDLNSSTLEGSNAATIVDALIFSCDNKEIRRVFVGGKQRNTF
ncbi:unnamed protein product [Caenorhabditis auriculariae]|uniref:Amidohydrolase-related domain-containing protein n=1 Tax=Caenorhabditis auriculariae TaxID=2777116 RepID=A0A8S1HHW8_9PELO|nr:unnamed protein product [Caenorhabditis auriculariae]